MKKRVLAALTAFVLILSAFAFTSCKEPTPKELFSDSFANAFASEENGFLSKLLGASEIKDQYATFSFKVDKCSLGGQTLTELGKIELNGTASIDAESGLSKFDASFDLYGDKPTLGAVVDTANSKVYYTDLFGLNEKPVLLDASSAVPGVAVNNTAGIDANVIKVVADAVTDVLKKNVTEDMFVSETKDVTVDGKTFQGATVITLDISGEKASTIAKEFVDALLADETIKEMAGEDGLKYDENDLPKSVKLINTVVDEKSVAFDIEATISEGNENIALHSSFVDGNFKLTFGNVDENGEYKDTYWEISYTLDGEKEKFFVTLYDDGVKSKDLVIIEGTFKDGKHEGKAVAEGITLYYTVTEIENGIELEIGPISTKYGSSSVNVFDVLLKAKITYIDDKMEITGNMSYTDTTAKIDFSASYSLTVEQKDVTVEPITDHITIDEFSNTDIESKLKEKYPTIYGLLNAM